MHKRNSGSIPRSIKSSSLDYDNISIDESQTSYEDVEGGHHDDNLLEEEEPNLLPPKTGQFYYQDYKYVIPTQAAFDLKQIQDAKLFDHTKRIVTGQNEEILMGEGPVRDASILVTGFGMRNVKSFQQLINMSQDQRRKWELRKLWRGDIVKMELSKSTQLKQKAEATTARTDTTEASVGTRSSRRSSSDLLTQTETVTKTEVYDKKHLDYLLGLEAQVEEEAQQEIEELEFQAEDRFTYSTSKSIRDAQRYLRVHRIFECFQFIVTHLLSARAENPIEFILNLLNKCLLYRSGLGEPPLLYEKKHMSQLFNLMDRLQAGYIDYSQYSTGMKTLGICTFNENPITCNDDGISKETFIEEAYEAELAIFDEFIRRRPENTKKKEKKVPKSFRSLSIPSLNPPFFIPSDLLKFEKPLYPSSSGE